MTVCTGIGGRGCPCDHHVSRRASSKAWRRKQRARELAARNGGATTCQARLGRFGLCGGMLETIVDRTGATAIVCERCERKRAGMCRDCRLPVDGQRGKALRCAYHTKQEKDAAWRRCRARDPEGHRAASRRNYQRSDERRRRKNEYKKAWRRANPEKVKAYKLRERDSDAYKRRAAFYFAEYRKVHRRKARTREQKRNAGTLPARLCVVPGCRIVVTHRKKKCTKCRERERAQALQTLAPTAGRGRRTDLENVA